MDLDSCIKFFNEVVRQYAKPSEAEAFDNLSRAAQRSIDRNEADFDNQLGELRGKNFMILWRQDWFVIDRFNWMVQNPYNFSDRTRFEELKRAGQQYVQKDQIEDLRAVYIELTRMQIIEGMGENMLDEVNVIKG
jgi:molecular chaperone DnaK